MEDEKLCLISIGLVIVIFAALAGMTYVDEEGWPWEDDTKDKEEILLIQEGDEVSVDYVGRLVGVAGEPGPVFDTSLPEVANDDSIPKTPSFMDKPIYDDLTFTVGSGQMIPGFESGVLNKKMGDSFTISIPPERAYGVSLDELIIDVNSTETIPMRETIDRETFHEVYPMVALGEVDKFIHPFWKWDVEIISFDPESVVIWHQPVYGERYFAFSWNTTVVDLSTDRNIITLHHNVEEINDQTKIPFFTMLDYNPEWARNAAETFGQEPMEGYVSSKGGVLTINFNGELIGKTLLFTITINSILRE